MGRPASPAASPVLQGDASERSVMTDEDALKDDEDTTSGEGAEGNLPDDGIKGGRAAMSTPRTQADQRGGFRSPTAA
jgi:hypothetical protein